MRARLCVAALALPVLLIAGCTDPTPPESSVATGSVSIPGGRDSCQPLTTAQVQPALAPPSASPSASPVGVPYTSHSVHVAAMTVNGALKANFVVDQCTYADVGGQSIIVTLYAPQQSLGFTGQISDLTDLTQGATRINLGSTVALYKQSKPSAIIAFENGRSVLSIAYPAGEPVGGPSREQRLATLAAAVLGVPAPSLPPVTAPVAQATPSASATPAAPAGTPTNGATAAATVNQTDGLQFQPSDITVKVGDVVEWKNTGSLQHNVIFGGQPSISSQTMQGGATYQVKFTTAGTYSYVCTFHVSSGMTGKVTVQ